MSHFQSRLEHFRSSAPGVSVTKAGSPARGTTRKYEGAARGKRTIGFPVNNLSPNLDIGRDAELLRQRSNYLYQNHIYDKKAINGIANGIVGTGIQPTITTDSLRAEMAIKLFIETFLETTKCDFNDRLDFYGLQKLVAKTFMREGECLVLRRRVKFAESPIGIQFQVLQMDYLATHLQQTQTSDGGHILNGIQYDKRGKVTGYWLFSRHPTEWYTQPELFPVMDVIHVLNVDFPAQNRGVPAAAPTIIESKDLKDYEEAELMGKKVQASHAIFRVTNAPEDWGEVNEEEYDSDDELERIEPGSIYSLLPGEQIQSNTPPTAPGAEDYRRSKQRNIATGYEITYEMLGDYSHVNFSSGRMGWIEHQRSIDHWQWMTLIPQFCNRAFGWMLEQLPLAPGSGLVKMPSGVKVTWTPPKREMLDPVKESTALLKLARAGFKSFTDIVKSMGENPEEVVKQIAKDKKLFEKYKLNAEWMQNLDLELQVAMKPGTSSADASARSLDLLEEILAFVAK